MGPAASASQELLGSPHERFLHGSRSRLGVPGEAAHDGGKRDRLADRVGQRREAHVVGAALALALDALAPLEGCQGLGRLARGERAAHARRHERGRGRARPAIGDHDERARLVGHDQGYVAVTQVGDQLQVVDDVGQVAPGLLGKVDWQVESGHGGSIRTPVGAPRPAVGGRAGP